MVDPFDAKLIQPEATSRCIRIVASAIIFDRTIVKEATSLFKYYLGIAIMCALFALTALFFSANAATLATVFLGMAGAFVAIAFVTSGPESRW
jgi:predicted phage tail protein